VDGQGGGLQRGAMQPVLHRVDPEGVVEDGFLDAARVLLCEGVAKF
jgi:hypothetical protein